MFHTCITGPREPWHDIHSKVDGPIAYDVFENFSERWKRQGYKEGTLTHIREFSSIERLEDDHPLNMDPQKSWNVQFFRSITSDSAEFDEEKVQAHVSGVFFAFLHVCLFLMYLSHD